MKNNADIIFGKYSTIEVPCDFEPFLVDPALTEAQRLDRIRRDPRPYEARDRLCKHVLVIHSRAGDEVVRAAGWRGYGTPEHRSSCGVTLCPEHSEPFECKGCKMPAVECRCAEILVGDRT